MNLHEVRDPEVRAVCARLLREGWTMKRGKHFKIITPCGRAFVTFGITPSDHRATKNFMRDIRHAQQRAAEMGQKK